MSELRDVLYPILKDHPGEMYVTDQYLAVLMPDDTVLIVLGDFRESTPEDANLALQQALAKME